MSQTHVTIKLPKELVEEMDKLIGTHGFRSRGEIAKEAIRSFLPKYGIQIPEEAYPRIMRINANDQGATLWDNKLRKEVNIIFAPSGIRCSFHETDNCEHVNFALKESDVIATVKKRRKEGWKLPDISS